MLDPDPDPHKTDADPKHWPQYQHRQKYPEKEEKTF
jgi:hypothetical protein